MFLGCLRRFATASDGEIEMCYTSRTSPNLFGGSKGQYEDNNQRELNNIWLTGCFQKFVVNKPMVTPNLFQSQVIYVTWFTNHGISITIFCIHVYWHCTHMCTQFVCCVLSHLDHSNLLESLAIAGIDFLSGWNRAVDPIIKASLCESDAIWTHFLNLCIIPEYLGLSIAEVLVLFSGAWKSCNGGNSWQIPLDASQSHDILWKITWWLFLSLMKKAIGQFYFLSSSNIITNNFQCLKLLCSDTLLIAFLYLHFWSILNLDKISKNSIHGIPMCKKEHMH